ncbi:hypothetical protein NQ315_005561 [Exocentrus adspersus]|uniref:Uncharacterized protein n=1 Tax=Exocentrus adspersus TaxID=1586481 RepID=A0AAV8VU53_9CUCU|nr:hypothetical protein NQ315_005561 [Exocentrus adspersus]
MRQVQATETLKRKKIDAFSSAIHLRDAEVCVWKGYYSDRTELVPQGFQGENTFPYVNRDEMPYNLDYSAVKLPSKDLKNFSTKVKFGEDIWVLGEVEVQEVEEEKVEAD